MPKRKPRYSDALNRPIVPVTSGLLLIGPKSLVERYIIGEWSAKLDLLLSHYGIGTNEAERWRKLAFCLALDHVPGMLVIEKPRRGKGAPKKWSGSRDREFVKLIEQIRVERGKGVMDAIRIAQKRKRMIGNTRGLERRYYEAKKRLRPIEEFLKRPLPVVHRLPSIPQPTQPLSVAKKTNRERPEEQSRFRMIGRPS
jgi:hypothetical protein